MTIPILTILGVLPMLGALVLLTLSGQTARIAGLAFSLVTLALGVYVSVSAMNGAEISEQVSWIPALGAYYALGPIDGLSLTMVLLTVILTPVVLVAAWNDAEAPGNRWTSRGFFALVLVLEGLSLLVFMATDVFLFYLLFEATLLPMYFLIGGFGGPRRARAAVKFLLFSLAGGLIMLASVIGLYVVSANAGAPSYLLSELSQLEIGTSTGRWLFLGFFIAFAIKAPMVPVHTWLPDAAEQATPATSTLLVGILDKIGTFGMIRFCLFLFPEASTWATPVVIVLAVISVLYGAIAAIGQKDLMRLIAFTSISHFGFIVLGIFAFTSQSMTGSIFYMLNHGFSTAALFLVVGYMVKRRGSQQMSAFGGVQKVAPVLAGFLLIAGLASMALPGLSPFISEFLVLSGTFSRYPVLAGVATIAIVLAALYILIMYQRTMTGPVTDQVHKHFTHDLNGREKIAIAPLVVLILVLGFFPRPMLTAIAPTVADTMQHVGVADPEPDVAKESK